ncbi:MAG: NlpC/P60 family protein [Bryobacteraceae bacterium]
MTLLAAVTLWIVNAPVVNLHAAPSVDAGVASQAVYGGDVEQIERKGKWVRIRTADQYTGWALKSGLRKAPKRDRAAARMARVDTIAAHLYREPDVTAHAPVLTLPYEARLEVTREADERWLEVRLVDGHNAWIQRGDISFDDRLLTVNEVIGLSRRFLGLPYTWGGASSFGYDCSGFTQMLCRRRGIAMPRDSRPQAEWSGAVTVARDRLEPGDLLFFGPDAAKINHTGLYVGGGEFIHATAFRQPRIQISRLDDPHWSELLRVCRRPRAFTHSETQGPARHAEADGESKPTTR